MSGLRARAGEYLAMRRALGFRLTTQGGHLMSFVGFCEERGAGHVTADLAVEWATSTTRGSGNEVYRDGRDVQARLPLLSTWLGHVDPKSTYWYLQAVPELLALAAGRLEAAGGQADE
ncbi:hypothetical protein [Trebonia kvetii]|nr:hypothetical protein [Trebonia kvetii]